MALLLAIVIFSLCAGIAWAWLEQPGREGGWRLTDEWEKDGLVWRRRR
jgi:type II secretory pathway component PulJ